MVFYHSSPTIHGQLPGPEGDEETESSEYHPLPRRLGMMLEVAVEKLSESYVES